MTHDERVAYLENAGETISPTEAARILGGNPYYYNLAAKRGDLTLPHMWRGRNLRIYTAPLMRILNGGNPNDSSLY